jgi:thiol-disulfide isomerase/thioredoxin
MNFLKTIFPLLILTGCFGKKPETTGLEGKPLPSFKLFLTDSTTYFDTKSIIAGKPVVLLYFGPYCPYSKAQVQEITDNMESLKDVRFYFITSWQFNDLKMFDKKYQLERFRNITAGVDYEDFFAYHFKANGVPFIAIYGKDNKLKKAFLGKLNAEEILDIVND